MYQNKFRRKLTTILSFNKIPFSLTKVRLLNVTVDLSKTYFMTIKQLHAHIVESINWDYSSIYTSHPTPVVMNKTPQKQMWEP